MRCIMIIWESQSIKLPITIMCTVNHRATLYVDGGQTVPHRMVDRDDSTTQDGT